MTIDEFNKKVEKEISQTNYLGIETTGDFQCDQTLGFPAILNVNWDSGKAWLSLNENLKIDNMDMTEYEQGCADWGFHNCNSIEDFNSLLESLGRDAYEYALPTDSGIEQSM